MRAEINEPRMNIFPRKHSKSLGRFAIVLNNHSCDVLVWWPTIVKDSFLCWLLSQQKAICKHIRLVHVSEFSYMKRNSRRRHDVDLCHFTKFIHINSLWHRHGDGYDISCHQMSCSNPGLCWALLHRSPVCLNTRICATAMNSSIFVIVKLRVCWCHFIKHATEGISPLCHHQSCIKLLLNLQFNEKSKTWKIIKSKCLEVSEYQEISNMFKSLYYNSSIVRQKLPKVHLTSPYISSLLADPFIAMTLDH